MGTNKVRVWIFFTILIAITFGFGYLLKPFFYPIFWAAVLASVFYPLYLRLNKMLEMPRLSSALMMMFVLLIIVIPVIAVGGLIIKEAVGIYGQLQNNSNEIVVQAQKTFNNIQHMPLLREMHIDESVWIEKFSEAAKAITSFIFDSLKIITQNSIVFILMFVLMMYTLFFFFKDGARFLEKAMHLIPLGNKHEKILYNKFSAASRAALMGSLIVGGVQGTLGGLMFAALGIEGAAIWGIIMVCLSVVPIGPSVVWFPTGIILLINGQIWQGVILLLFGLLVISTIDNLLRPIVVGRKINLHPLLILFSTLGGILAFGFTGFLIGPILTALVVSMWEIYDEHYKEDLLSN